MKITNDPTTHRPEPTPDEVTLAEALRVSDTPQGRSFRAAGLSAYDIAKHGMRPEQLAERAAKRSLRR